MVNLFDGTDIKVPPDSYIVGFKTVASAYSVPLESLYLNVNNVCKDCSNSCGFFQSFAKLAVNYAKIVYVNATNPNSATIFDLHNPPVTNDNALKTDVNNLYIATDASTWIWDSILATYVTKTLAATSNFYLDGSSADAGSSKDANIHRTGSMTAALTVFKISTNRTLSNTDNGKIIVLTSSATITIPNGLMNGFNCSFSTLAGVTMTYALGGSVTLLNNNGTTMAEKLSHTIVNTGVSNEYLTAGSL